MVTVSRVPFAFTLIDKRHKLFVKGKRNTLITLAQCLLSPGFIIPIIFGGMGLFFFLWPGIRGLAYDLSVRNDWVSTDALIIAIVPIQDGDRFNWQFLYTFQTEEGQQISGLITEERKDAFIEGQLIPVRYLRNYPKENVYALDPMPKNVLYWFFVGMGSLWIYITVKPIYRHFLTYRSIRAISHRGRAVSGEIIEVHHPPWYSSSITVEVEYAFTSPAGSQRKECDRIPIMYLTGNPKPRTTVAVWWVQDGETVLL